MPAAELLVVSARTMGTAAVRRSRTFIPLAVRPPITARLNARAAREWSRPTVTMDAFGTK